MGLTKHLAKQMSTGNSEYKHVESEIIREYSQLSVRQAVYRLPDMEDKARFVLIDSADWVLILPITREKELILIRQFRPGVESTVLEIPGGIIESNESIKRAAARELEEETGYQAERYQHISTMLPNPALNTARMHVVLATGCRLTGQSLNDPFERIEVVKTPLSSIGELIENGSLQHALCIASLAVAGLWSRESSLQNGTW